jgi:hypothetical protein
LPGKAPARSIFKLESQGEYHMLSRIENIRRSNYCIFLPQNYGSPFNDTAEHISGLGLARIDFERCAVAGEVIYTVEGDSTPTSQQEEEARIATLAYALKKLGNPEDAAEFIRCLNEICKEDDARYRQVAASYYYGEIAERGAGPVLKEMALIAMHLASLNPVAEELEGDSEAVYAQCEESKPRSLFDREVAAVNRMIRGRRKGASFAHDEWRVQGFYYENSFFDISAWPPTRSLSDSVGALRSPPRDRGSLRRLETRAESEPGHPHASRRQWLSPPPV